MVVIDPYVLSLACLENLFFVRRDGQHHQYQAHELVHMGDEPHGVRGVGHEGVCAQCSTKYTELVSQCRCNLVQCILMSAFISLQLILLIYIYYIYYVH